jgi:hypothetical protein
MVSRIAMHRDGTSSTFPTIATSPGWTGQLAGGQQGLPRRPLGGHQPLRHPRQVGHQAEGHQLARRICGEPLQAPFVRSGGVFLHFLDATLSRSTITSREIQTVVRPLLPSELAKHDVAKYTSSKYGAFTKKLSTIPTCRPLLLWKDVWTWQGRPAEVPLQQGRPPVPCWQDPQASQVGRLTPYVT